MQLHPKHAHYTLSGDHNSCTCKDQCTLQQVGDIGAEVNKTSPCMPPAPMGPDTICACAMEGAGTPSPCMWCAGAAPGTAGSGGRGAPAPAWGCAGRGTGAPGWPAWPGAPCSAAKAGFHWQL